MLKFNANLFRIAMACASDEVTRYYLKGVYVEPHAVGGVLLVATNGHKLVVIHDVDGSADESAIINLGDAIKLCKPKHTKHNQETRFVVVEGDDAKIIAEYSGATGSMPIGTAYKVRIDGVYPDYRRVIPQKFENDGKSTFDGKYLADFGKMAVELSQHADLGKVSSPMRIVSNDSGPALVSFPATDFAFGILMPIRCDKLLHVAPEWFGQITEYAQAAE